MSCYIMLCYDDVVEIDCGKMILCIHIGSEIITRRALRSQMIGLFPKDLASVVSTHLKQRWDVLVWSIMFSSEINKQNQRLPGARCRADRILLQS